MSADDPRFDRIYMVGHAHLDPVWLWRWTEGYQEARATLHAAVNLLAENPDYVFTFEQMAVVDWIRESDPALFAQLQDLVAAGRIAMVRGALDDADGGSRSGLNDLASEVARWAGSSNDSAKVRMLADAVRDLAG